MGKYVWCEDSGSGFLFWTTFFHVINPEIVVESKRCNSGLIKAVKHIEETDENQYYILLDNAVDNPSVLLEVKKLSDLAKEKNNVTSIKVHSFEFVLLSFQDLEKWIFAEEDELKDKREDIINAKNHFVTTYTKTNDASVLAEVQKLLKYNRNYNSEQLSAKLLLEITRNTGFETKKGAIGECFILDCCNWQARQSDDICGLENGRLSQAEKMLHIREKSVLKNALEEAGF